MLQPPAPSSTKPFFRTGDPVYHKLLKNSPLMIIQGHPIRRWDEVQQRNRIVGMPCYWFNDKMERQSGTFETDTIRHLTREECLSNDILWKPEWALQAQPA